MVQRLLEIEESRVLRDLRLEYFGLAEQQGIDPDSDVDLLSLEDALAAVDKLQGPVSDLMSAVRSASQDLSDAMTLLADAQQAGDVEAAHSQALAAANELHTAHEIFEVVLVGAAFEIELGHRRHGEAAVAAGEISQDEHYTNIGTVWESITALLDPLGRTFDDATQLELPLEPRDFYRELSDTADAFALADAPAMAAYRASLSESCQP